MAIIIRIVIYLNLLLGIFIGAGVYSTIKIKVEKKELEINQKIQQDNIYQEDQKILRKLGVPDGTYVQIRRNQMVVVYREPSGATRAIIINGN